MMKQIQKILAFMLALALALTAACAFAEAVRQDIAGAVEDGDYKNVYAGFGFHCGEWEILSEAEIASVYGRSEALLNGEFSKAMEQRDSLCFFAAKAGDGTANVSGVITNQGAAAGLYHALGFRNMYMLEEGKLRKNLASYGIGVSSLKIGTVIVDGREMACMRIEETLNGGSVSVIEISLMKGPYRIDIAASAADFESAEAILARFFWL